jgi:adenylyltransferase/sulfurtransferase
VLGILPGIVGTIQATEAIKLVLGRGESLVGRLLLLDALAMSFRELKLRKDPGCALCGESPTIRELVDYEQLCGAASPDGGGETGLDIDPTVLKERFDRGDALVLVDVRTSSEWAVGRLDGARHIPLRDLPRRVGELGQDEEIVVCCKRGVLSARAAEFLREQGFARVLNMAGGLKRWAAEIDPSLTVI